ncbi:hypothetical protein [Curtobacterium sp. MCBD17_040]|uniref:hypothetical protein n=1 Tax=Curtobacterium sp. MCBD17_040 TaxID=2175674 RepID=UPI000DA7282C|nr:hypothetical protein [Curtobacterium sp. MCBD17_040]WIB65772.1 hypothetical protein DEI94_16780 [Curtobacterium sp. MCBD17_040]
MNAAAELITYKALAPRLVAIRKHMLYRLGQGHFGIPGSRITYNPFSELSELEKFAGSLGRVSRMRFATGASSVPSEAAAKLRGEFLAFRAICPTGSGDVIFWGTFNASAYQPRLEWALDEDTSTASGEDQTKMWQRATKTMGRGALGSMFELTSFWMDRASALRL